MYYPEGVFSAMLTPFDKNGNINEEVLRALVDFQIEGGLHGLFPTSSSGEAIHMNHAARCLTMDIVMDETRGRVPVFPGIPGSTPQESIALAAQAKKIGCEGVVLMPPYFYKPSPGMITAFFKTVIEAVNMPVVIYNIPLFTIPIPYDTVRELAANRNVVGMKDSSGNMVDFLNFMDMARLAGNPLSMLTGREEMLLSTLCMGGKGCMAASAVVVPEVMVAIYDAWKAGEIDRARELQLALVGLGRSMMTGLAFPNGFKAALEARGFAMGPSRLPLPDDVEAGMPAFIEDLRVQITTLVEQASHRETKS